MRLLDKPLSIDEFNNEFNMLQGNINLICLGESVTEVIKMLGFAVDRLNLLAYSQILELKSVSKVDESIKD